MTGNPESEAGIRRKTGVAVGLAFLLTLAFFWPTLRSFPGTWGRYGMSQGWLVAGLVAWLLWRDRENFSRGTVGAPLAMLPLAALSLLWFVTTVAHIQLFHQLTFVLLIGVWGFVVFGREAEKTLFVGAIISLFALPLWEVLVPILRPLTTLASGSLVRLLGIPVEIEGDLIHITAGSFEIADGCAGLNYLLAGLVIGAAYALILVRGWPAQIAVVVWGAVISIVGNWVRVVMVVGIGHVTEMRSGLIENHGGLGWVVFSLGLIPFFVLSPRIERWISGKAEGWKKEHRSGETDAEGGEEMGREEPGGQKKRAIAASGLAALGPILYLVFGALPAADAGEMNLVDLPRGEQWRVEETAADRTFSWRPAYKGAGQEETESFTDGRTRVFGHRFVYREQRQGAKLVGYPNRIAPGSEVLTEQLLGPLDSAARRWVQQAMVMTSEGPILSWYWYRVGGVDTFSPIYAKLLEVPAFLARRRTSEFIALSTACEPDNCRDAFRTLVSFMGMGTN